MITVVRDSKISELTWIADTGASSHMTNSLDGMFDLQKCNTEIKLGNGKSMKALKQGKYRGIIKQDNGKSITLTLQEVKYVPELWTNLLSLTKVIQNGAEIRSKDKALMMVKGNHEIIFNHRYKAGDGFTLGIEMVPIRKQFGQACAATNEKRKTMNIEDFHRLLGHPGEEKTKETAKWMNIELKGKLDSCESCDLSKSKRKKISKVNLNKT
jgi:hypothetical protein